MWRIFLLVLLLSSALPGGDAPLPQIDKAKLEAYLRYIEGYTSGVKLLIDNPSSSAYPGYFRILVHVSFGAQKVGDRLYYVTSDGEKFINGSLWDLNENPFLDTLDRLPTDGPSFGPATAKVTMVVFSDFQCPYCREFAKTLREHIPQTYQNDVRVVFKDFPIETLHPWARAAAEAGECIAEQKQDAFWAFHDWIFDHQQEISAANVAGKTLDFAKSQPLDPAKLSTCLSSHATAKLVDESVDAGRSLQVQQTPTVFVNGRLIGGAVPWNSLDAVIQLELNRPKEIPGPSTAKCCEITAPTIFESENLSLKA